MSNDEQTYREVPIFAALAMCMECQYKWIAHIPPSTSLFKLECPQCGEQDSFASVLPMEYIKYV